MPARSLLYTLYAVQHWYPLHAEWTMTERQAREAVSNPPTPNLLPTLEAAKKYVVLLAESESDGELHLDPYVWEQVNPSRWELRIHDSDVDFAARITKHEVYDK